MNVVEPGAEERRARDAARPSDALKAVEAGSVRAFAASLGVGCALWLSMKVVDGTWTAALLGSCLGVLLMCAALARWGPRRALKYPSVLVVLVALWVATTEPFLTRQISLAVFVPALLAMFLVGPVEILATHGLALGGLLWKGGWIGVNAAPPTLLIHLVLAGGMALGKLTFGRMQARGAALMERLEAERDRAQSTVEERDQALEALRSQQARYQLITEHTRDLIALLDARRRYVYLSPSHEQLLEQTLERLLGSDLKDHLEPSFRERFDDQWTRILEVGTGRLVVKTRGAEGRERWIDALITRLEDDAREDSAVVLLIARDITEQRELEVVLAEAQRLEGLGRLAGGVAHDFNNLLTAIGGHASLLELTVEDPEVRSQVQAITYATQRAASLTRQLLAFASRQVLHARPVALDLLIRDAEALLRPVVKHSIALSIETASSDAVVCVDPGQIEQVVLNLVVNASDALPGSGRITLKTGRFRGDGSRDAASREYAGFVVRDDGEGMPPEVLARAFEPFFTTKPQGKGTGLGLSTCYGIARQHGGDLLIESAPGSGTTVTVLLPIVEAAVIEAAPAEVVDPISLTSLAIRVLVAEDGELVRGVLKDTFEGTGCEVVIARDGEVAWQRFTNASEPFDLLVTDVIMPTLGGEGLAARVRERHLTLPILFISGYSEAQDPSARFEHSAFLPKPFDSAGLLRAILRLLSQASSSQE